MTALAAKPSSITITIMAPTAEQLRVRSVDLSSGDLRHRVSSPQETEIEELFVARFASFLRQVVARTTQGTEVMSFSDLQGRFGRLVIRGVVVMVRTGAAGMRQLIIRVREAVGTVFDIFRPERLGAAGIAAAATRDRALDRLYLPIVNLDRFLGEVLLSGRPAPPEGLSRAVADLKLRIEEVNFALQALVSDDRCDRADRQAALLDLAHDGASPAVRPRLRELSGAKASR